MRFIEVERAPLDRAAWSNRRAVEADAPTLIAEDVTLIEHDVPLLVYQTLPRDEFDPGDIAARLLRIEYNWGTRANANTITPTRSRTFGYQPRAVLRRDYCTAASLAYDDPDLHAALLAFAKKATERYYASAPALAAAHATKVEDKVLANYRIAGTPFTSGIVNFNNPLPYHLDSGNDHDVWSAMLCFRRKMAGGELVLPQLGMRSEIADNSLLLFDGQKLLHGVTPIRPLGRGAYRFTAVYYSRREMWRCLPPDEEVARIQRLSTERARKRASGANREEMLAAQAKRRARKEAHG